MREKTVAGALGTLDNVMRFAVRNNWIAESPVDEARAMTSARALSAILSEGTRARGDRPTARQLPARLPRLVATALYTGMRLSELLGLTWNDVDFSRGLIHVRAQLSRAHVGSAAHGGWRPRLGRGYSADPAHARSSRRACCVSVDSRRRRSAGGDWVFSTRNGTPLSQRNVQRSALSGAGQRRRPAGRRGPACGSTTCAIRSQAT